MKIEQYPTWLVPIGIAKKLKIIGFDIPCEFSLPLHLYEDFDIRELEFDFEKDNHNDYLLGHRFSNGLGERDILSV